MARAFQTPMGPSSLGRFVRPCNYLSSHVRLLTLNFIEFQVKIKVTSVSHVTPGNGHGWHTVAHVKVEGYMQLKKNVKAIKQLFSNVFSLVVALIFIN